MPKKIETHEVENLETEKLILSAIKYNEDTKVITALDKDKKSLRGPLERALESQGVLTDKAKVLHLTHAGMEVFLKHSLRFSTKPKTDEESLNVARQKGYTRHVEIIDEELVAEDMAAGRLLQEDFDKMFTTTETKVFTVEVKSSASYGE